MGFSVWILAEAVLFMVEVLVAVVSILAQNLGEIKGEFLAETKDKLAIAQQKLIDAIDYVADYPPLTWLKNYIPSHEKSEKAEQSLQNGIQNGTIVESHDE